MRHITTPRLAVVILVAASFCIVGGAAETAATASNPIVLENQQPGTTSWQFTNYNKAQAHEIEGYASLTSVNKGSSINFMVSLSSSAQYTMDFYRLGWYPTGTNPDGTSCAPSCGGRLMLHVGPLNGVKQAACPRVTTSTDPNFGLTECQWTTSYTLTVPTTWTTGNYIVKLTRLDGTHLENWMTFVVRDDSSTSAIVYSFDVNTWQAYNFWAGSGNNNVGINLYGRINDVTLANLSGSRAYTVSFDRPYLDQGSLDGAGNFMTWDFPLVRWMESQGYDVSYITDVDLEANSNILNGHRAFVNTGHDEYYSDGMRARIQGGISAGVNMAFLGANNIYHRTTWGSNAGGAPLRRVHTDKGTLPGSTTVEWRYLQPPQPENAIAGVMQNGVATSRPFLVYDASNWIYAGTGLVNYTGNGTTGVITSGPGQNALPGLVGYEFDTRAVNDPALSSYTSAEPAGLQQVGHSFVPSSDNGINAWSDAVVYTAGSGATVFSAGTIQWAFGVDNGYNDGFCSCDHTVANTVAQRITGNILTRFSTAPGAPAVSLIPSSLTFGSQTTGTTSSAQPVTLTNSGSAALTITSIGIAGTNAGDYSQSNTCPLAPSTLAAASSCTISVRFAPTATGTRTASLTITDNAAASPQGVSLTGSGTAPTAPGATLAPTSLDFDSQRVNTTSEAQTATLTNTGTSALTITSIGISGPNAGDFAQTTDCPISPSTLAPTASCAITATFTPTAAGTRTASVVVTDDASGSPQNVALGGTGTAPLATISPTGLDFGSQLVNTTGTAQTTTLTNTGTAPLTINSIALGGANPEEYAQTNTCPLSPSTLAVDASCTLSVTFTPNTVGSRTASVSVTDDAAGSPQSVALTGTGTAPSPAVTLSPAGLSFGSQRVSTTSEAQSTTLTNTGTAALTISGITITGANSGDYAQTNTCPVAPSVLEAAASCTISVTFAPSSAGSRSASLTITDDAANNPQSVPLSGTGLAPSVSLSPASLAFEPQLVGTPSATQTSTLTNTGGAPLAISSIALGGANPGEYTLTNDCPLAPSTLDGGLACTISVTFTPTLAGARPASVTIAYDAAGSPRELVLSGEGTNPVPAVTLTPSSLDFGPQRVGTTSASQTTILKNVGTADLTIDSIAAGGDFAQTNDCPATLAPDATCTISVTFAPTAAGSRTGIVSVVDDAANSPQGILASGTGTVSGITLTPASLTFSSRVVGSASAAQTTTLTSSGTAPLAIAGIAVSGPNAADYAQTNDCPTTGTLAVNASCTISVTFAPTASGTRTATVTVTDDAPGSPQAVALTGTGVAAAPAVTLTPTTIPFGSQRVGTTSAAQSATMTNSGTVPLTITGFAIMGANAGDYAQTNTCPLAPATLAVSESCTISMTFTPGATGSRTATVSVADDAVDSPQTVALSGTGVAPAASLTPSSLTFATQVGTTSSAQTATFANTGTAGLTISSIGITGANAADFAQTNTCPVAPASLAASASCTISVKFTPGATGSRSASVTISHDAADSPHTVALTGTGSAAIAFDKNLGTKGEKAKGTQATLKTAAAATTGARVFVFVNWNHASQTLASVSGGGLTWTVDRQAKDTSNFHGAIASASAPAGLAAGTVITATFSGSVAKGLIAVASFTGIASTSPLDVAGNNLQAGAAAWTASVTTTNANDLVLAWSSIDANALSTPIAPNVEIQDFGNGGYDNWATSDYRIETTAGAKTVNGTWSRTSGATANVTVVAAYRAR